MHNKNNHNYNDNVNSHHAIICCMDTDNIVNNTNDYHKLMLIIMIIIICITSACIYIYTYTYIYIYIYIYQNLMLCFRTGIQ